MLESLQMSKDSWKWKEKEKIEHTSLNNLIFNLSPIHSKEVGFKTVKLQVIQLKTLKW